ncbi:MAG: hypothetical protein ACRDAG_09165 [Cetobacterium somerae]|mgnify:CR=1 FL=1|uniref:Uncharacterized protein n=1 Tax=Cetobacterium somerae ATCC BAA-474 TaxID=1319815 RepID=U7V3J9_9FUSO|nr:MULTISPECIES: hypothetical protein [Cetobacterium]ERT66106.1 hypothetical protein HMPREF0202_02704 [Cetobacterium somerae ATCC BAA-474]MBC2854046.1 hypothetical protein [Cetobacterium sp. 2G large]MCQ9627725.1 hypothetical protein [Cetobacterium somerae]
MNYFLFLNHPKGKEVYKVSKEREEMLKEHFSRVDILETEVVMRGIKYKALVDYSAFSNLANFDCFKCQDPCCADNPTVYEKITRDFVLENIESYNKKTKNIDILLESGYEVEDIIKSIKEDECMVPNETVEAEISLCTCSFKPNNESVLCSLHSICLEKNMSAKEIVEKKPLVCSLWPIDIISEEDKSLLYITVPDDFTTGFTIEDYYDTPCINKELAQSSSFRRKNPIGFLEDEYVPIILAYGETLKYSLGEKFYNDVKEKLVEENLIFVEELIIKEKQIFKK